MVDTQFRVLRVVFVDERNLASDLETGSQAQQYNRLHFQLGAYLHARFSEYGCIAQRVKCSVYMRYAARDELRTSNPGH